MRGKFITLEGIEGAGKSTCAEGLCAALGAVGVDVVRTREPGGTDLGEAVRELLLRPTESPMQAVTELILMFAARAEHLATVVRPALDAGRWVVCDRFTDASRAYQGAGRGLREEVEQLAAVVHGDLVPDLTLLLDVPVALGLQRAARRSGPDRFEEEGERFMTRVRQAYLDLTADEPDRFALIDATLEPASVIAAAVSAVDARLGPLGLDGTEG
jgi:dTMP kinase